MAKTALLVMDMQNGIISQHPSGAALLPLLTPTLNAARSASIPLIYVTVSFRPGHPELSERSLFTPRVKPANAFVDGDESVQVHAAIAPQPGDICVTKRRISAFGGSDLDVVLRGLGVETVVLAGMATSGVVLSTALQAVDLDYSVVVLRDLCADPEEEVQRVLMEKVFPRRGKVVSTEEWLAGLGA